MAFACSLHRSLARNLWTNKTYGHLYRWTPINQPLFNNRHSYSKYSPYDRPGEDVQLLLHDANSVRKFVKLLSDSQKRMLQDQLILHSSNQAPGNELAERLRINYSVPRLLGEEEDSFKQDELNEETPLENNHLPRKAYCQIIFHQALPFVGFGFLDNFIMIVAGDYIDLHLGMFGISTMAAAGFGNTISDILGIGSAWYIENICAKVGIDYPTLTPEQEKSNMVRLTVQFARVLGITAGCLLGMFPLLFMGR